MKAMKHIALLALLTAFAIAAPAVGAPKEGKGNDTSSEASAKSLAKRMCQTERKAIGRDAFRERYGDGEKNQHAMRNCKGKTKDEAEKAKEAAVADCKSEREADAVAFAEKYGTNKNDKNAFGKCVSSSVKNAAKECKAEQQANPQAFADAYGTNKSKKNAFGKCVSGKVKEAEPTPAPDPAPYAPVL